MARWLITGTQLDQESDVTAPFSNPQPDLVNELDTKYQPTPSSNHNMLRTIEDQINSLIASRVPVSEILAAAPTADFDPMWGLT